MLENSYLVWEGESFIDGSPIFLVLTGFVFPTSNRRTGRSMIQSWILQKNLTPTSAAKQGLDVGICGSCEMKMSKLACCYVNLLGVNNIYYKHLTGTYSKFGANEIATLKRYRYPIRIGSYGDPTAVPFDVWEPIIFASNKHTGYTHRWRDLENDAHHWKNYLMASVHTESEAEEAQKMGWRTFRIIAPDAPLSNNEILCRNAEDDFITCDSCLLCNGSSLKPNIADRVHGLNWKVSNFVKYLNQQ